MHPGSRLLLMEVLSPERVEGPDYRVDLDLLMMVLLDGRERTESQYRALIEDAGFTYLGVIPISSFERLDTDRGDEGIAQPTAPMLSPLG